MAEPLPTDPTPDDDMVDPGNRSLNEALQTSFRVLRLVMIVMSLIFLFSGIFKVNENEVAVRTRFGALIGEPGERVLRPGGPYFSWPSPIDEVIRVPTVAQRLTLDREFWFQMTPEQMTRTLDELQTAAARSLVPGQDGSLMTGDQNIVHARFTVTWRVNDRRADEFVTNVATLAHAEQLVRAATESAVVKTVATVTADELIASQIDASLIRAQVQQTLDQIRSGIEIETVNLLDPTAPMSVRPAFQEVTQAESEKAERIEAAERERSQIQNEVAGTGYRALLATMDEYERAINLGEVDRAAIIEQAINRLLEQQGTVGEALSDWLATENDPALVERFAPFAADQIGGRVSEIINSAKSYRTSVVEQVRGETRRFTDLLEAYRANPTLTRERLWIATRQEILSSPGVETFYLTADPGKRVWIEFNRDPQVRRRRETARLQAEMNAARGTTPPPEIRRTTPQMR